MKIILYIVQNIDLTVPLVIKQTNIKCKKVWPYSRSVREAMCGKMPAKLFAPSSEITLL